MVKKFCLCLLLFVFIQSCKLNEKTIISSNDVIELDLNPAMEKYNKPMEDIVQSIEKLVPLETTEESIVGDMLDCIITDEYIYIKDIYGNYSSVIIFDTNGKFIMRLKQGNGPGEIISASYVFYDYNTEILYVANSDLSMNLYKNNGDFIKKYSPNIFDMNDVVKISDGFLVSQYMNTKNEFKIMELDSNFVKTSEIKLPKLPLYERGTFAYSIDGNYWIVRTLDNNIYKYYDDSVKLIYHLNYSDYEYIVNDHIEVYNYAQYYTDLLRNMEDGKYIFENSDFQESDDYMLFRFATKYYRLKYVYYHKKSGKIWSKQFIKKSFYNIVSGNTVLNNHKNTFYGVIIPERIFGDNDWRWDGKNPNNLLSDNDMKILKNAKEDDNPIIVIYKLKDEI